MSSCVDCNYCLHNQLAQFPKPVDTTLIGTSLFKCSLPSQDEEASCNVYASNLPLWVDEEWLRGSFSSFGIIVSCKVMYDSRGVSKGYGFIQFTTAVDAQAAVKAMHGVWVDGRWMNVKMANRDKNKGLRNQPSNNLYLCNLPKHFTQAEVKGLFQSIPISNMTILKDSRTKESRGVALVRLPSLNYAMTAIETINGLLLPGHDRPIEVKYAESEEEKMIRKSPESGSSHSGSNNSTPPTISPRDYETNSDVVMDNMTISNYLVKPSFTMKIDTKNSKLPVERSSTPPLPSKTLYIEDIQFGVDDLYLYQLCSPFGAIEYARMDWSGDSGRIRFLSSDDAAAACAALDGKKIDGGTLKACLIDEPQVARC
eukprot:NODE_873_length_2285_cov_46.009713_g745_i0.p1 GENE.NODE_873_length_2285_cov_46.009713_g745_i0~~NODE_873_length_2285_cov_46.009713_g745_i0.p1  ORF type:complete len:370 (+),score=39.79 NODE_873_length_2285_cov_46.009713_g745_i0:66-1175(+)